jgi:hypothetical protein
MHAMVRMPFLPFLCSFKFDKNLLCIIMQVDHFLAQDNILSFPRISKASQNEIQSSSNNKSIYDKPNSKTSPHFGHSTLHHSNHL